MAVAHPLLFFIMRLLLVIPGLAAAVRADPARAPHVLARLAALGGLEEIDGDPDRVILQWSGAAPGVALAPLAALGAGFDPGERYVLRADPVALVAGRDDVLCAGRVDDLTGDDAAALRDTLAAHFGADGLAFHVPRPDAWFITAAAHVPVDTTALAQVTGPLQPHLPAGPNGKTWRRWLSEMQMLLHAHPVNAAREARGQLPVTGIWIAEGGTFAAPAVTATLEVHATRDRAGDVARGLARCAGGVARPLPPAWSASAASDALVVLDPLADDAALSRAARAWLEPATAALVRGGLDELIVAGDGGGRTQRWRARAPTRLRRWLMRLTG